MDNGQWNVQYGPSIIEEMFVKLLPVAYKAQLDVNLDQGRSPILTDGQKVVMAKEVLRLAEIAAMEMDEKEGEE